jgi:hypothetical protein
MTEPSSWSYHTSPALPASGLLLHEMTTINDTEIKFYFQLLLFLGFLLHAMDTNPINRDLGCMESSGSGAKSGAQMFSLVHKKFKELE